MANPPSYEESASEYSHVPSNEKLESKDVQHFNIQEEVGASRSQHVAALVSKLLPQVRERAKSGLSKSTLLLLPFNQGQRHTPTIKETVADARDQIAEGGAS